MYGAELKSSKSIFDRMKRSLERELHGAFMDDLFKGAPLAAVSQDYFLTCMLRCISLSMFYGGP